MAGTPSTWPWPTSSCWPSSGCVTTQECLGYLFGASDSTALRAVRRWGLVGKLVGAKVGALGDLAYVGIDGISPRLRGATPRRKPRGQERPPGDRRYNRAFARRRIRVEHAIGRLRKYQCLSQVDRHHRRLHTARVRAVAGLVNRMLGHHNTD